MCIFEMYSIVDCFLSAVHLWSIQYVVPNSILALQCHTYSILVNMLLGISYPVFNISASLSSLLYCIRILSSEALFKVINSTPGGTFLSAFLQNIFVFVYLPSNIRVSILLTRRLFVLASAVLLASNFSRLAIITQPFVIKNSNMALLTCTTNCAQHVFSVLFHQITSSINSQLYTFLQTNQKLFFHSFVWCPIFLYMGFNLSITKNEGDSYFAFILSNVTVSNFLIVPNISCEELNTPSFSSLVVNATSIRGSSEFIILTLR